MTVRETFQFVAAVTRETGMTDEDEVKRIDEVLRVRQSVNQAPSPLSFVFILGSRPFYL